MSFQAQFLLPTEPTLNAEGVSPGELSVPQPLSVSPPVFPAANTGTIPAARSAAMALSNTRLPPQPPQELFTTCGRRAGSGLVPGQIGRRQHPLEGSQGRGQRTGVRRARHCMDPLRARRDADVGRRPIPTGGDAGHMCAVADGSDGIGIRVAGACHRVDAEAGGVVPVVVVVHRAGRRVPAAVLPLQRRVIPVDAGVHDADDDPLAGDVVRRGPDGRGADPGDAPRVSGRVAGRRRRRLIRRQGIGWRRISRRWIRGQRFRRPRLAAAPA